MLTLNSDTPITPQVGTERGQAVIRLFIGCAALAYCLGRYVFAGDGNTRVLEGVLLCATFVLFSVLLLVAIMSRPSSVPARRIVGMSADFGAVSILMYLVGESASVFAFVYLWVIIGNGLRYGSRFLYLAMALGISSYVGMMLVTPYWIQHRDMAIGMLLSLILLPVYFASLLRKINAAHRELERLAEQLKYMAMHDTLTDLPNRRFFVDSLGRAMAEAERRGERLALLFVDLDGFKPVNDTLGHKTGDELLRTIGARLRLSVREGDLVARLGGDEFVIILEAVDRDRVGIAANKIISAVGSEIKFADARVSVSCSIGIAIYPDHSRVVDALFAIADAAMRTAKSSGKNRYHIEGGETSKIKTAE